VTEFDTRGLDALLARTRETIDTLHRQGSVSQRAEALDGQIQVAVAGSLRSTVDTGTLTRELASLRPGREASPQGLLGLVRVRQHDHPRLADISPQWSFSWLAWRSAE
jgi:hypothetical protein